MNAKCPVPTLMLAVFLVFPGFASSQQVDLSPSSLKFDPQLVGSVSPTKDIVLTNSGNANLVVSSIAASGGYSVANNCSTVTPGASCTIKVSFISGLLGSTSGVITITDNAATSPQLVNIAGSTLPPLEFSPARIADAWPIARPSLLAGFNGRALKKVGARVHFSVPRWTWGAGRGKSRLP